MTQADVCTDGIAEDGICLIDKKICKYGIITILQIRTGTGRDQKIYKTKLIDCASEDVIRKAIQMDHQAFSYPDWISEEDAYLIYLNKRDCFIWLSQEDEPVGFVTIFPLNEKIPVEAVGRNQPIYKLLTQDVLSDLNTGVLYCHCFLLLPQYRGKGLIYELYNGLKEWLEEKGKRYTSLYADAVSEEGCRCLERLGFQPVHSFNKEGALYRADKISVMSAVERYGRGKHFRD